jgi:Flp pilus assembly protein CpaB
VLSALLAAAACALVVTAFAPPQVDETVPVLVAARDLVGGALVVEGDVAVARWPAQVAPPGRLTEPGQALGRALTTSVGAGEALTPTRLLKSGTGPPGGADRVVTAVAGVDRATLGVLRAGDRVDLLAPATGATLADAALVVADPVVASGDDLGPDGAAGSVLLALRPAEAVALARARAVLDLPLVVVVRARPG